jgi:hypothetical protein
MAIHDCTMSRFYSVALGLALSAPPSLGNTITVNTSQDTVPFPSPQPRLCTLRDAIRAANDNRMVGGCAAGNIYRASNPLGTIDLIAFDLGAGVPSIQPLSALPTITEAVAIDGNTGGAERVEISGRRLLMPLRPPSLPAGARCHDASKGGSNG